MTLVYFDDLKEKKNIILEMSEIDVKSISVDDAKFLHNQLNLYYLKSNENDDKWKIMETFVKKPENFKHMDLIRQLETDNLVDSEK
jgi:ATP synthase F1 complex assembly factor 1